MTTSDHRSPSTSFSPHLTAEDGQSLERPLPFCAGDPSEPVDDQIQDCCPTSAQSPASRGDRVAAGTEVGRYEQACFLRGEGEIRRGDLEDSRGCGRRSEAEGREPATAQHDMQLRWSLEAQRTQHVDGGIVVAELIHIVDYEQNFLAAPSHTLAQHGRLSFCQAPAVLCSDRGRRKRDTGARAKFKRVGQPS
jgi:hypothetical protein